MGIRRAVLKSDSQVITGQVDKSSKARDPKLEKYLDTVRRMEASFEGFSMKNNFRMALIVGGVIGLWTAIRLRTAYREENI